MSQNIPPSHSQTISVTDWIIIFLLQIIPIVGLVMLFIWAFGSNTPPSKANYAKANLLLIWMPIILVAIFMVLFGTSITSFTYQKQ